MEGRGVRRELENKETESDSKKVKFEAPSEEDKDKRIATLEDQVRCLSRALAIKIDKETLALAEKKQQEEKIMAVVHTTIAKIQAIYEGKDYHDGQLSGLSKSATNDNLSIVNDGEIPCSSNSTRTRPAMDSSGSTTAESGSDTAGYTSDDDEDYTKGGAQRKTASINAITHFANLTITEDKADNRKTGTSGATGNTDAANHGVDKMKRLRCTCGKLFLNTASLYEHIRKYSVPEVYRCYSCGLIFLTLYKLQLHQVCTHDQAIRVNGLELACTYCQRMFRSQFELAYHRRSGVCEAI